MDILAEVKEVLARSSVCELMEFLDPWIEQVTEPSEEANECLDRIFQDFLEHHEPMDAMSLAFWVGAAWEKALAKARAEQ